MGANMQCYTTDLRGSILQSQVGPFCKIDLQKEQKNKIFMDTIHSQPRRQPHIVEISSGANVSATLMVSLIVILQLHITLYLLASRHQSQNFRSIIIIGEISVVCAVQVVDTAMSITENSRKPHTRD